MWAFLFFCIILYLIAKHKKETRNLNERIGSLEDELDRLHNRLKGSKSLSASVSSEQTLEPNQ